MEKIIIRLQSSHSLHGIQFIGQVMDSQVVVAAAALAAVDVQVHLLGRLPARVAAAVKRNRRIIKWTPNLITSTETIYIIKQLNWSPLKNSSLKCII